MRSDDPSGCETKLYSEKLPVPYSVRSIQIKRTERKKTYECRQQSMQTSAPTKKNTGEAETRKKDLRTCERQSHRRPAGKRQL